MVVSLGGRRDEAVDSRLSEYGCSSFALVFLCSMGSP